MSKKNSNGYYNGKVLAKFNAALRDAMEGVQACKYLTVKFSDGNAKMGSIPSVSTLPFLTCPSCCKETCGKACYAAKLANIRPNVLANYAINTALAIRRPDLYWTHISDFVKTCRYFRFHVSGDIINYDYSMHMVRIAKENPHCEILAFTKRFDVVNRYIEENNSLPENMHILFSGWNNLTPDNPHNLPETTVFERDEDFNPDWKMCGGKCFECVCRGLGCWQAKSGDIIAFKKH